MEQKENVTQIEWWDSHFYKVDFGDGKIDYFPSVTSKLNASPKPFLARWRGDVGNQEADRRLHDAEERGSRIHYAWYTINTGGTVLYNPFMRPVYMAEDIAEITKKENGKVFVLNYQEEMYALYKLQRWCQVVQPEILMSEKVVYSIQNRDAGQMDNLMRIKAGKYQINGKEPLVLKEGLYVFDLKSGNSVDSDDAPAQVAAYANCLYEMEGLDIEGTLIVHTNSQTRTGISGLSTILSTREEMKENYKFYRDVASVWERKLAKDKPKLFEFPSLIKL